MAQFNLLGPLEVVHNGKNCTPSPPMVRKVLAILILGANQVVHVDRLIEELWDGAPPASAVTTVQTYIYQLRRAFVAANIAQSGEDVFVTKRPGYMFVMDPEQLDAHRFQQLSARGRTLLENHRPDEAAAVLRQALDLWTGPALENVALGRLLRAHAVHLEEQRLRTLELRIQADVALGRQRELVGELRSLTLIHPLNEWFHGQLMMALSSCGRRSEALDVYQRLRVTLREELGLDPSPELQRLQRDVLAGVTRGGPEHLEPPSLTRLPVTPVRSASTASLDCVPAIATD